MDTRIESILDFWFGELDEHGYATDDRNKLWFQSSAETDIIIRTRFGELVGQACRGELDNWAETARGRLALIIVLDQFTRNINRGSAAAFKGDSKARQLCKQGQDLGHDQTLAPSERVFFYLPLEHSENLTDQEQCVALYSQLHDQAPPARQERALSNVNFARQHKAIIEQFGRFPHRNKALGRGSTPQELEYLKNANSFGQ